MASLWIFGCLLYALSSHASDSKLEIIPIEDITQEIHPLALQEGVIDARIHNLRIGQVVALHSHSRRPELVLILRGTARVRGLRLSKETGEPLLRDEIVEAGNLIFIPATALHAFSNVGLQPLWCLVMLSPPFATNNYLRLAPPDSTLDFLVLPIDSTEAARGSYLPDWLQQLSSKRRGPLNHFPNISAEILKGRGLIEAKTGDPETWLILLQGSGTLSHPGGEVAVHAPTLIRSMGEEWSVRGGLSGEEMISIRLQLPSN